MRDYESTDLAGAAHFEQADSFPEPPPSADEYMEPGHDEQDVRDAMAEAEDLHLRDWNQPCGCPSEYHLNDCPHVQRDDSPCSGMSKEDWLEVFSDPDYDFDRDDYPF